MLIKSFTDEIFNPTVVLITDCSYKEYRDYLISKQIHVDGDSDLSGECFRVVFHKKDKEKTIFYVFVRSITDCYTLMHEVVHLVSYIFKDRGVPFTINNDETIAYYHEMWVHKLWLFMSKEKHANLPNVSKTSAAQSQNVQPEVSQPATNAKCTKK